MVVSEVLGHLKRVLQCRNGLEAGLVEQIQRVVVLVRVRVLLVALHRERKAARVELVVAAQPAQVLLAPVGKSRPGRDHVCEWTANKWDSHDSNQLLQQGKRAPVITTGLFGSS